MPFLSLESDRFNVFIPTQQVHTQCWGDKVMGDAMMRRDQYSELGALGHGFGG